MTLKSDRPFIPSPLSYRSHHPFAWDQDLTQTQSMLLEHYREIRERMDLRMAERDTPWTEIYQALPEMSKSALSQSPSVYEALQTIERSQREPSRTISRPEYQQAQLKLGLYILAEAHRVGITREVIHDAYWTASRDYVADPQLGAVLTTRSGIVVNYDSYPHRSQGSAIGGYSEAEASHLVQILDKALDFIEQVSPATMSLIRHYVSVIDLFKDHQTPEVHNTSLDFAIGKLISHNLHLYGGDLTEIIDFLVHEAIHQYVFTVEKSYPLHRFTRSMRPYLGQRDLCSPWTGSLLDLGSYCHAVIVWYGLFHFWRKALAAPSSTESPELFLACKKRYQVAAGGFIWEPDLFRVLGLKRHWLQVSYHDYALALHREVRDLYREGL